MIGSDEDINMGSTNGNVLVTILGDVDGIKLEIDDGIQLGFLDGSFDSSNDDKHEGLLIGDSI